MRGLEISFVVALAGLFALGTPALAQDAKPAAEDTSSICTFVGESCSAPPSDWNWQRLEPRIGVYSVEIPCNAKEADAGGRLLAMTPGQFQAGATRACMKASSGFIATLIGFAELPDGPRPAEVDELLQGEPDLFSAMMKNISDREEIPQTAIAGRRAIVNTIEKPVGYSKVAIIEVSQFGVLMIIGDIRKQLEVSREEGDAMIERFFNSLEFVE